MAVHDGGSEVVAMRWLALTPYAVLVAFVWVNMGARPGIIVLTCVLVLTAGFRLMAAGAMIRSSARRLCGADSAVADFVPAAVGAGWRLAQSVRDLGRHSAGPEQPRPVPGDDVLVPVLLANGDTGDSGRTPEILGSGGDDPPRS